MTSSKSTEKWAYERVLGSGGFGQVELWIERYTCKKIAIKRCMMPSKDISQKQSNRWKKEIDIMKKLQHPNIVKAVQLPSAISFKYPVLCMEFCNRGNLRKVLNEASNACGLLQNEVLSLMKDVSSALMYLHYCNITHRDLKPENIVLHDKNNVITHKLIDLGFAKELGNNTATASLVGTFNYVAPELFMSNKYKSSVDYWSLGVTFFEVLTGYKPFVPQRQNLFKWYDIRANRIRSMETKKYHEICAQEVNGEIKFCDHVIHANDLSDDILNKLTEWFRIALQWDPKKRGKRLDSDETVVFSFLKEIFPKTTINVFFVTLYRIDRYHANDKISLADLQRWIEQRAKLSVDEQIIANIDGKVFDGKKNFFEHLTPNNDIPGSMLYVYKKNSSLRITEFDCVRNMPERLNAMLTSSNEIQDRTSLKQCYTSFIYIMRHELDLFKQYVFAVGTKYDTIKQQIRRGQKIFQKCFTDAESLLDKVKEAFSRYEHCGAMERLSDLYDKIENVNKVFCKIKCDIDRFTAKMDDFFNSERLMKNFKNYKDTYDYFLNTYEEFEAKISCSSEYICLQIDTLQGIYGEFDEIKKKSLTDKEMVKILRELVEFENKFFSYDKSIEAGVQLIVSYEKKIYDALARFESVSAATNQNNHNNSKNQNMILVTGEDTEIKDNIVLRSVFDEYLKNIQETWSRMKLEL